LSAGALQSWFCSPAVTSWFAGVVTNIVMFETDVVFFFRPLDVIFPGGGASGCMPKLHLEFLANQFG
jgi:hypothetical protein